MLPNLQDDVCEHWLFHGSNWAALESISNSDFDLTRSGSNRGQLYGRGIYCAECSSKSDEYAEQNGDGIRCMMLCRVTLGKLRYIDSLVPAIGAANRGTADTILGD